MLARGATRGLRFLRALQQPCRGFAEVSVVPDHVETVQAPSEQQQQVRLLFLSLDKFCACCTTCANVCRLPSQAFTLCARLEVLEIKQRRLLSWRRHPPSLHTQSPFKGLKLPSRILVEDRRARGRQELLETVWLI